MGSPFAQPILSALTHYIYINNESFSKSETLGKSYGPLGPGIYEITFIDAQSCQLQFEYILDEPDPISVDLQAKIEGGEKTINLGDSVFLEALLYVPQDAVESTTWTPALAGSEGRFSLLVKPEFSTSYNVNIIDENGCEPTDGFDLLVNRELNVFMANIFRPSPEGNNGLFMVQGGAQIHSVLHFMISDRWGINFLKPLISLPMIPLMAGTEPSIISY